MSLLATLLPASHVLLDVPARDKRELLDRAAGLLEGQAGIGRGQILDSLLARERLGSTGLGKGVAIPHGRIKGLSAPVGAFLRARAAVPFDAPDDAPVRLVFVLLVPERSTELHLQILGELAQMLSDRTMRADLGSAPDAAATQRLIAAWRSTL
ncbi:MAG: PTS sugar transporter subunit IIA [Burkholderiales bacterium]|nr:PTS sugar transporter subunit IIA [Burkholderiales bacterium]